MTDLIAGPLTQRLRLSEVGTEIYLSALDPQRTACLACVLRNELFPEACVIYQSELFWRGTWSFSASASPVG
jgi:hypothetical protein